MTLMKTPRPPPPPAPQPTPAAVHARYAHRLFVVQCCSCRKMRMGDTWLAIPPPRGARVSHGFCPGCLDEWLEREGLSEEG